MSIQKYTTVEKFEKYFREKFPEKSYIEIISFSEKLDYRGDKQFVLVSMNGELYEVLRSSLMTGHNPRICSSVDSFPCFYRTYSKKFPSSSVKPIKFLEWPYVLVENQFGLCKSTRNNLMYGKQCKIRSALDKTSYWKNQMKLIHKDKFDYSQVTYIDSRTKVNIVCKKHGIFKQAPSTHSQGIGCPKCKNLKISGIRINSDEGFRDTVWSERAVLSKNFKFYTVYIIRCWNDDEVFYKIGKTYRNIERRFPCKSLMPYKYEIVTTFCSDKNADLSNAKKFSSLERSLHKNNKQFKYLPKLPFGGSSECYSEVNYEQNNIV